MKKVIIYARVSSDLQKKEGTIESQILELKKQVSTNGDVLVKEYIDDGHSGAQLDRPAMDQLRKDLKTNIFETLYFLNADRIAREVTYQTIIISEILKNNKQIIINGKDYVHNPENKFTLTVLGAVSELERAKIVERSTRGRQMRLSQGCLMGSGNQIYGYKYIRKTPYSPARYEINEEEAKVVKFVFEKYANEYIGTAKLSQTLEEMGAKNKGGKVLWRTSLIKVMLKNEMYIGIRHYNMFKTVREYANPMLGINKTSKKLVPRDKSNWIPVAVPSIISRELFQKVQERIEFNKKRYRRPVAVQLLSWITECGYCSRAGYAYRRYYKDRNRENPKVYHVANYKCGYSHRVPRMHAKSNPIKRCNNKEIRTDILEYRVFSAIKEQMLDPEIFKNHIEYFKRNNNSNKLKIQEKMDKYNLEITNITQKTNSH